MKIIKNLSFLAIGFVMSSFCLPDNETYLLTYVKYLMNDKSLAFLDEYPRYTLIYIDTDNIPEMVLQGESDGDGLCVLTLYEGKVFRMNTTGLSLSFIEKSGLFSNHHCDFGECGEEVYRLQGSVFVMMDAWRSVDYSMAADFFESNGSDGDETEIEEEIKFYFNDKEVDEISAERLLNEVFYSKGKVIDINDCEWFDKDELLKRNN